MRLHYNKIKMEALEFFRNRHTVRTFSNREITDAELRSLIEASSHAPNTGNMQWYSVVATRSAEGKRRLSPLHFGQPCVESCAVVLTFCVDLRRFEHWCRLGAAVPGFENPQSFFAAFLDASIFAQQTCTLAEQMGMGGCFLGTTLYNAPQIAEVLELPERVVPIITLALGWPDTEGEPSWRLPADAVLHMEKYNEADDARIREDYASLEALPESAGFIEENGKETLAQVFTDIRYTRQAAEQFSATLMRYLRQNRFFEYQKF